MKLTQTHPTQAQTHASNARNAVDSNASNATHAANARNTVDANARNTMTASNARITKTKNASYTRCTTSTDFCVLKACMLIIFCQRMLAFLLYKRLHHRCRRRRNRFWAKEIGRCNCLPCVIIPKIIFHRFCIHRVQSYRTGYSRTKLIDYVSSKPVNY